MNRKLVIITLLAFATQAIPVRTQRAKAQSVTARRPETGTANQPPQPSTEKGKAEDKTKAGDETTTKSEDKTEEGAKKDTDATGDESSDSIKRPDKPVRVPDPREFDVTPDKNALLKFTFHGQMWPDLMQWLASVSGRTLDWQELPSDFVHVSTERPYTIVETRNLFNRLLFERGYTIVEQQNVLLVVKISKLDPSLLPRVEDESDLLDLPTHDFVKMTFPLPDKLKADRAAEDVKPLLTQHAKVQPLMATNRLLIVDLVGNLRDVSRLINAEHAAATRDVVPKEFPLRFARADHVADQVMILLGLDPSSRRTPQELQLETQRLQLFSQMHQKGKDVTKYLRGGDAPHVFLSVNHRNNSIVVNAPPAEMGVIERAIQMLDVPVGSLRGATSAQLSMVRYQLVTLRPESIVTALQDIGELDPRTRLRVDSDAKMVFANATPRDHDTINAMIDSLDGSGRQFEVVWLRRLPADRVAATIRSLMVGKQEEKENRSPFFYYSSRRSNKNDDDQPNKGFRIEADIENNRLLLWATDSELDEVRNLLTKLGEIPGRSGNPNTLRVLERRSPEETKALLQQLKQLWPAVGPNELKIDDSSTTRPNQQGAASKQKHPRDQKGTSPVIDKTEQPTAEPTAEPVLDVSTQKSGFVSRNHQQGGGTFATVLALAPPGLERATHRELDDSPEQKPINAPPIVVTINHQGQLVFTSRDTEALDRLEDLIAQVARKPKNFEVFYLRNAMASLVTINLEEYFEDELNEQDGANNNFMRSYFGFSPASNNRKGESLGLNQRRKLRFIYDFDTNSIIVSNASPSQLEVVRELIDIYDKPVSDDAISARRFQIFKIKHAPAESVAKTIKEVYRDLLSSKDKVFQTTNGQKEQTSQTTTYYRVYGSSDDDKKPKKIKASFKGALSVGVDKVSNTVIVSAQEEWMSSIAEMISFLDEASVPSSSVVRVVNTRIEPVKLKRALDGTFGRGQSDSKSSENKKREPVTTPGKSKEVRPTEQNQ